MRGQGHSTGYSYMMSRVEMNDLKQFVSYVKTDEGIDTANIGIIGSSQGGIIPFMAACYGEKFKYLVSDLASPEFASSWIENGCVKTTLIWSLMYDTTIVRYSDELKRYRKWILSKRIDYRDSLETYFPKNRDFLSQVNNLNSPVLFSNSWQDKFFNTMGVIKAAGIIDSNRIPLRVYFGAVPGHGSDEVYSENNFHSGFIGNWVNFWMFGEGNPGIELTKYTYSSSSNPIDFHHWYYTQSKTDVWPPAGIKNMRLYFSRGAAGNALLFEQQKKAIDTISFLNDVKDKKLSMTDALDYAFTGNEFSDKFAKAMIYFETPPLENDTKMTGMPKVFLRYTSSADVSQFNFQIWEVDENGGMNFVTRINYTDWKLYTGAVKEKVIFGQANSHIFKAGSRIRVYVTNIDNGPYDEFLGTNPFVLPVLKRAKNIIFMNDEKGSYIELPVEE